MRDYKILTEHVLTAFDVMHSIRDNVRTVRKNFTTSGGMIHKHYFYSDYDPNGNREENYVYSCRSELDPSLNYGFEISNYKYDRNKSEIYIGNGDMIKYTFHPLYLDDILIRIKITSGQPCEELPFRTICEEYNHFMMSTISSGLPETDELMNIYEFAQKIRPMLMLHKCYIVGSLPKVITHTMINEVKEIYK